MVLAVSVILDHTVDFIMRHHTVYDNYNKVQILKLNSLHLTFLFKYFHDHSLTHTSWAAHR